jgi:predicted RNase H-like HicB family nuclease
MHEVTCTVHIEPAEEGGFIAYFPVLPGCHTQGDTFEEVIAMAKDVLVGYLETLREHGDPIPQERSQSKQVGFEFSVSASLMR